MNGQRFDEEQLRSMSTRELLRHAMSDARALALAEVRHAKLELRSEVGAAKRSGLLLGVGGTLLLCSLAVLCVAAGLLIPWSEPVALGTVGLLLLVCGVGAVAIGASRMPRQPLPRTRERLRQNFDLARGRA